MNETRIVDMLRADLAFIPLLLLLACSRQEPVTAVPGAAETELVELGVYNTLVPEPSGLAYDPKDSTLYAVSDNAGEKIYKISLTGVTLSSLAVNGNDMEGITFTQNFDTLVIVEEGLRNVVWITLQGQRIGTLHVNVPNAGKNGLEAITINPVNGDIFVGHQDVPELLIQFHSDNKEVKRTELIFAPTISDLYYDQAEDVLWMLSAKAQMLYKITTDGVLLKSWSLPVDKPEGITFGTNNRMYICCDQTGKLYVFNKPQ